MPRTLIFPNDHPYYPNRRLTIPDDATQEDIDATIDELSKPHKLDTEKPAGWGSTLLKQPKELMKGVLEGYGQLGAYGDPETGVGIGGTVGGATGEKPMPYAPESPYAPPSDTLSRYVRSAGQNVPAMTTAGPGWMQRLLFGPGAGIIGEATSDIAKRVGIDSPYAKTVGAVLGPSLVRKGITPAFIDPRRNINNEVVRRELGGLAQTAGQATNNKIQMSKELKARPSINEDQADALHHRVTAPTGSPTTNITPEWLQQTGNNIRSTYDNLEQTTGIIPRGNTYGPSGNITSYSAPDIVNIERQRPQDTKAILDVISNVNARFKPSRSSIPGELIHDALFNQHGTGNLSGQEYRRLRSNLHSAAENAKSNETAHAFRQTARALDNEMARTNPAWGQAWNANNRRFANFRMAQLAANANKGKDQFPAKSWITAGHKTMGPEDFANSESGRFLDAYSKVMPELKEVKHEPSPLTQLAVGGLGALAGSHFGLPSEVVQAAGDFAPLLPAGEGLVGGILGLEAARPISQLFAGKSIVPQMSAPVQWYKKQQMMPLPPPGWGRQVPIRSGQILRALINKPQDQNKQPETQ